MKKRSLLIVVLLILCQFGDGMNLSPQVEGIWRIPARAEAKTTIKQDNSSVSSAVTIQRNKDYENVIASSKSQYYCLMPLEKKGEVVLYVEAEEMPSFSFQLYDEKGKCCSTHSYQYEPYSHKLQVHYILEKNQGYLFVLTNLLSEKITYTIHYQTIIQAGDSKTVSQPKVVAESAESKETKASAKKSSKAISKPKQNTATPKPKKSIVTPKPTTAIPRPKKSKVTSKPKNIITTSKPKNTVTTSKSKNNMGVSKKIKVASSSCRKSRTEKVKLQISNSFLKISKNSFFTLEAVMTKGNISGEWKWNISDPSAIESQKVLSDKTSSSFIAKAKNSGIYVITCTKNGTENKRVSCTVKVR